MCVCVCGCRFLDSRDEDGALAYLRDPHNTSRPAVVRLFPLCTRHRVFVYVPLPAFLHLVLLPLSQAGRPVLDAVCARGMPRVVVELLRRWGVGGGQLSTAIHTAVDNGASQSATAPDYVLCVRAMAQWCVHPSARCSGLCSA